MAKKIEKANSEPTRAFVVLREIKHNGQRYKEGDTIDLTHDEWVVMHDDGRVSREEAAQREGDSDVSGEKPQDEPGNVAQQTQ